MSKHDLTAADARSYFDYDAESGNLTWKVGPRRNRIAGCYCESTGYVHVKLNRHQYLAHRLIWLMVHGYWPANEIDHRNRVRSDNSLRNLREALPVQNRQNVSLSCRNTSGFMGASFDKRRRKWRADIRTNYKGRTIGFFETVEDAAHAYLAAARSREFFVGDPALDQDAK